MRKIEVLCGDRKFDWHKLGFLVKYFRLSGWKPFLQRYGIPENEPTRAMLSRDFVGSASSDTLAFRDKLAACHGKFSSGTVLTELLFRISMMRCLDLRDTLYSILGIVQLMLETEVPLGIKADYNIDVLDVWAKAIKLCLETCPDLAFLSLGSDKTSTPNLPSWIPALQELSKHRMDRRLGLDRRRPRSILYNVAYAPQNLSPYRHVCGRAFQLRGSKIGILAKIGIDISGGGNTAGMAAQFLPSMLELCNVLPLTMRDG